MRSLTEEKTVQKLRAAIAERNFDSFAAICMRESNQLHAGIANTLTSERKELEESFRHCREKSFKQHYFLNSIERKKQLFQQKVYHSSGIKTLLIIAAEIDNINKEYVLGATKSIHSSSLTDFLLQGFERLT